METPASDSTGPDGKDRPRPLAIPTERDAENARRREAIAQGHEAAYVECLAWALGAFGPGWIPSHRHYLVEKDEEERARRTGEKPKAAATVFTVRDNAGQTRHFTVEGGRVHEHAGYEAGFGSMLLEPHPTQGFEHRASGGGRIGTVCAGRATSCTTRRPPSSWHPCGPRGTEIRRSEK